MARLGLHRQGNTDDLSATQITQGVEHAGFTHFVGMSGSFARIHVSEKRDSWDAA